MKSNRLGTDHVATTTPDGTPPAALADAAGDVAEAIARAAKTPAKKKATAADHLHALETKEPVVDRPIVIPKLDIRKLIVKIVGDSALVCHRFNEKQIRIIREKQTGVASEGRKFKDPKDDFERSLYPMPFGEGGKPQYGFPALAFKSAGVSACTSLGKTVTKVMARQAFHVMGDLVLIHGEPTMREDTVRVGRGKGTADLRYRGEFKQWWCELLIRYNGRVLSDEQIINLLNVAGFAVGVGEWRVERNGQYGLFHVE